MSASTNLFASGLSMIIKNMGTQLAFGSQKVLCTCAEVDVISYDNAESGAVQSDNYILEALKTDFYSAPNQGDVVTHPDGFRLQITRIRDYNGVAWRMDATKLNEP